QQQAGGLLRAEHVAIPPHRIVHLGVVGVLPGLVPDVRGVPVVLDVAGGGEEAVLADPDLLAVLHRQGYDLARVVVGQRHVPGAAGLHHDQRQPRHLPVPRALQRHVGQPGLRLGPEQHVMGEVDPVLGREGELRGRGGRAGDLHVRLAELQPGHVPDRRLLDPAGVTDHGPDVDRRPAHRALLGREFIAVPDDRKDQIVFKWPDITIRRFTRAIVNADEMALFVNTGQVVQTMGPGRHQIDANELPGLGVVIDSITGGNAYRAELYFVGTREYTGFKFGG